MLYKTVAKLLYKLWCAAYFTKINFTQPMHLSHAVSPDLTSNPTRELPTDPMAQFPVKGSTQPRWQQSYNTLTNTANTSKKAMENPASIGEETHTEEGAQQHLQIMKLLKSHIHNSTILDWWYPM